MNKFPKGIEVVGVDIIENIKNYIRYKSLET